MVKHKPIHMLSVDSETGIYWNGHCAFHNQAQVNTFIKPALFERSSVNDCAARANSLVQLAANKIIRTTAKYFEVSSFRFM